MSRPTWNWGFDTTDETKPDWPHLRDADGQQSNTFATESGWVYRHPFGDETIIAIGNLNTKLGIANADAGYIPVTQAALVNAAAQAVEVFLLYDEGVTVTGVPTIQLITDGTGTAANVIVSYNAAESNVQTGKVSFTNASFSLAHADYANTTLTLNSSCILTVFSGIKDAVTANAVANTVPAEVEVIIPVYQEKPVQTATIDFGAATDIQSANQFVAFDVQFNEPVTVTGVPTLNALATTEVTANLLLSYSSADSDLAAGNVVFKSTAQDFSALTQNGVFTANTTSGTAGWSGILDGRGNPPIANASALIVANTFTIVQNEPFVTALANGANITNTTNQTISFSLKFDRKVLVIGTPTILGISNSALANVTLAYASGNNTNTLVFSSGPTDYSTGSNTAWFVNATSTLVYFAAASNTVNGISNTGSTTQITALAVANNVKLVSA